MAEGPRPTRMAASMGDLSALDEAPASRIDVRAVQSLPAELPTHRHGDAKQKTIFSLEQHIHSDKETFSFLAEFSEAPDLHCKKQLLAYDLRKLIKVGGLFSMFARGSVFRIDSSWAADTFNVVVVAIISAFAATAMSTASADIISNLMDQASQLVPVVLGLYVSLAFGRWWTLREGALGRIFTALTDVAMMMACALPEDAELQEDIARLGLASIELLINAARIESDFEVLVGKGLLTVDEAKALEPLEPFQRAIAPWAWILRISLAQLHDNGPRAAELYKKCLLAREGILLVEMSRSAQVPFAYVHLQAWLVSAHNLIVAIRVGLEVAVAFEQGYYDLCVGQVFIASVICVIYRGVLSITHLIHDPFGPGSMGFPIMAYVGYIAASLNAIRIAQKRCPAVERLRIDETGCTSV